MNTHINIIFQPLLAPMAKVWGPDEDHLIERDPDQYFDDDEFDEDED